MAEALPQQQATALPASGDASAAQAAPAVNPVDAFLQSHVVRHIGRLVGLAFAIALGVVVALWMTEPNYAPLYSDASAQDLNEIANVLDAAGIEYKIDSGSGAVLVPQSKLPEARLKLAAQGLPGSSAKGFEMLQEDQGFGTSQFMESARYNHALETELARSVESIRSVEQARVHLALPKQSIFIRNRSKPSASVVVKLYAGRTLSQAQVEAIVNLVAASVPLMEPEQVTVVDQFGRLLSSKSNNELEQTNKEFEYTRKLESSYAERIVQLLQPIVGEGKVNAEVSAALDFSLIETTREAYDPERSVIRSEKISEQETRDLNQAIGIPGALSNQPPGAGTTDPEALAGADNPALPANQTRSATRNFEVDRTISHTRSPRGSIERLTVAVVVDSRTVTKEDGSTEVRPWSEEQLAQFEKLVKEAIGYKESRGDSVSIINAPFAPVVEEMPEVPMWQQLLGESWIIDLVKQVLGAIGLLIVYLMFIRPFLRSLKPEPPEPPEALEAPEGEAAEGQPAVEGGAVDGVNAVTEALIREDPNSAAAIIRRSDATHEQKIEMARTLVMDDPARVANVMKQWVDEDQG
jgi:flagellar M-ring protein FliF